MPVTLAANALVTVDRATTYLGSAAGDVDKVTTAVNEASQICESWCNRALKKRAFTDQRLKDPPTGPVLYPPWPMGWPIDRAGVIAVTFADTPQSVWKAEGDGAMADFDVLALDSHFYRGAGWGCAPYNVRLTFSGGYDPVPEDLQAACLYIVARRFSIDAQKSLTEIQSLSAGVGSVSWMPGREFVMPGPALDILRWYQRVPV